MCLTLIRKTKRIPKPRIAKKDILIYKVVKASTTSLTYFSPYYDFRYILNKRNKKVRLQPEYYGINSKAKVPYILYYYVVNEGYHAFTELKEAKKRIDAIDKYGGNHIICKAVIPKGEKYFKENEEIVASNIILTEEVN